MSGAGYVAVQGFERPRAAPVMRVRDVEVRAGHLAQDIAFGGRTPAIKRHQLPPIPRRPAGPKRGQVKAAIAQSVLQTLSAIVKNARTLALRRSFSRSS